MVSCRDRVQGCAGAVGVYVASLYGPATGRGEDAWRTQVMYYAQRTAGAEQHKAPQTAEFTQLFSGFVPHNRTRRSRTTTGQPAAHGL